MCHVRMMIVLRIYVPLTGRINNHSRDPGPISQIEYVYRDLRDFHPGMVDTQDDLHGPQ